ALYPLDLFIIVNNVEVLKKGIYHFDPHRRGVVKLQNFSEKEVGEILLQEENVKNFSFAVVISASFWLSRLKYGHRSYRFTYIEAGHVLQNMILLSTAPNI